MDTSQLLRGTLDAAVLAVVAERDGYGYDVLRRLRAAGLSEVGDASVYGTLRRLYGGGALTSYGATTASRSGVVCSSTRPGPAGADSHAPSRCCSRSTRR
jgi:hypothetical protein